MHGHTERVNALRSSNDGALIASTSTDGTAIVWDVATGELRETLDLGENEVQGHAFGPDATDLYTAGMRPMIRVWDLVSGQRFVTGLRAPGECAIGWAFPSPGGHLHGAQLRPRRRGFFDSDTGAATDFVGPPGGIYGVGLQQRQQPFRRRSPGQDVNVGPGDR